MKLGYARASTADQNLNYQLAELERAGCEKIFKENVSGKKRDRPELNKLLEIIRPGDSVVVYNLRRLGRSLKDLIDLVTLFNEKKINFISLQESIDTSTATGRLVFNFFAALAEFERENIVDNTRAGLAAAKAAGRNGGRPAGLSPEALKKAKSAQILKAAGIPPAEIVKNLGISRASYYRYLEENL